MKTTVKDLPDSPEKRAFEAELVGLVRQKRESLKHYDSFEPSYSLVCGQLDILCEILGRTEKDVLGGQT